MRGAIPLFFIMIKRAIFFIILLVFIGTAQADYNPNGTPLLTVTQGQVNGGVYVGGGHGLDNSPTISMFPLIPK
jgi:hypothetical protein